MKSSLHNQPPEVKCTQLEKKIPPLRISSRCQEIKIAKLQAGHGGAHLGSQSLKLKQGDHKLEAT